MITLQHIHKVFNDGTDREVAAVKDVSLIIQKEEFVTMIGANGSGKSTLLNLIAGSLIPDEGSIMIGDQNITSLPEHKRCKWIARVFQNPLAGTASDLSVLENFRLASIRTQSKSLAIGTHVTFRNMVKSKIETLGLGLENKLEQPMGTLSGGQRQALTLLMAVMDDAEILLLDEPTAALDPKTAALIMQIADNLVRTFHLTAILVTHNLKDALNFGTRIIQLHEGSISRDIQKKNVANLSISNVYEWFE